MASIAYLERQQMQEHKSGRAVASMPIEARKKQTAREAGLAQANRGKTHQRKEPWLKCHGNSHRTDALEGLAKHQCVSQARCNSEEYGVLLQVDERTLNVWHLEEMAAAEVKCQGASTKAPGEGTA